MLIQISYYHNKTGSSFDKYNDSIVNVPLDYFLLI